VKLLQEAPLHQRSSRKYLHTTLLWIELQKVSGCRSQPKSLSEEKLKYLQTLIRP